MSRVKDKEAGFYIFLTLLSLVLVIILVGRIPTGPPNRVVFAAGPSDGAYYAFANRYKELLGERGLSVEVLETGGSMENLRLLRDGKADIAFVQSGLSPANSKLMSLGAVFPEPLWFFAKAPNAPRNLNELLGKTVAIGTIDSGTREVALAILDDSKMTSKLKTMSIGGREAVEKLLNDEIDAAFFVGSQSVESIRTLALDPTISLGDFERVQAYARYHSSLFPVTLYAGMLDLSKDVPPKNIELLSTACSLVVAEDFNYALVTLFLQTADKVHRPPGPFQEYGEYPNPENVSLPLMPEADQFFKSGPSFFFRYLPFFWAATVDRLIILLLPLLTLLFPLFRVAPPLYGYFLRRKLLKKQMALSEIELNVEGLDREALSSKLDELEAQMAEIKTLPPNYQNEVFLYQLRLERVREQLGKPEEQVDDAPENS